MKRSAIISPCGLYRYRLDRVWGDNPDHRLVWVMLNPSTADGEQDDPTIRRCIAFSKRDGYDALTVVNLAAYRATDPATLLQTRQEWNTGESLNHALRAMERRPCVAAWGSFDSRGIFAGLGRSWLASPLPSTWLCLGRTKDGCPRHPLYVRADQPFEPYRSSTEAER